MADQFSRTAILLGENGVAALSRSRIAVFGVGGVGAFAIEALARAGVGHIDIVDNDIVAVTNLNRQLVALHSTIGMKKTAVMKSRILDINPDCSVTVFDLFFSIETLGIFDFSKYDYVIDAIDTVTSKLLLAQECQRNGTRIISSMGTGGKLDPELLRCGDIFETSGCPLARVMRRECRKRGIKKLEVVFSPEEPSPPRFETDEVTSKKTVCGTVSFVPSAAGLILAGRVIRYLSTGGKNDE